MQDLISRQAAIDALANTKDLVDVTWTDENDNVIDSIEEKRNIIANWLEKVPTAQPEPFMVTIDHELTKDDVERLKQSMSNTPIVLFPSVQPEPQWIPCSERLPEDLEEVNVTWVNHNPEPYYYFVKGKPFTASAVYYKGKWFWYTSTCADLLAEYGKNPNHEIDDAIEITAWIPLPEPWKGEEHEHNN